MAENPNKISQIQVGDITYDICDVAARDKSAEIESYLSTDDLFLSVKCTSGPITLAAEGTSTDQAKTVTWTKNYTTTVLNDYKYLCYENLFLKSTDVSCFYMGENEIRIRNLRAVSFTVTDGNNVGPEAFQIYIKKF